MAHCSQPLLSRRVQHRFRCTSGPRHRRSAMRSMDRLQVQTSSGWMDIGNQLVTVTGGSGDAGTVLHMKGHTGVIRIMTTTAKAGKCTRDIGTMRTTTMDTGENMIMSATIMITTTITTDRFWHCARRTSFDSLLCGPGNLLTVYLESARRGATVSAAKQEDAEIGASMSSTQKLVSTALPYQLQSKLNLSRGCRGARDGSGRARDFCARS